MRTLFLYDEILKVVFILESGIYCDMDRLVTFCMRIRGFGRLRSTSLLLYWPYLLQLWRRQERLFSL